MLSFHLQEYVYHSHQSMASVKQQRQHQLNQLMKRIQVSFMPWKTEEDEYAQSALPKISSGNLI